jgi:hypothetical protein
MLKFDLDQFRDVGSILMLIGGFIELSLPLEYVFDGKYSAIPTMNLILSLLSLIGCVIVWKGNLISGGLLGILVGLCIRGMSDFFIYRDTASGFVVIGGIISIIIGFMKRRQES